MFRIVLVWILILLASNIVLAQNLERLGVIPGVSELRGNEDVFPRPREVKFVGPTYTRTLAFDILEDHKIKTSDSAEYLIDLSVDERYELEGYYMKLGPDTTIIRGGRQGLIWGLQTFNQLMLLDRELIGGGYSLPIVELVDQPAFQHRGMLLDCCRHFFSVETVKKYIDLLSLYKMNTLHWHLTEDQGWRIEIDAYPKLTEVGAWRTEKDRSRYGGYYTKEEIKEVVSYAATRGINVIPEIELPGHAQAALSAYPEYSCKGSDIEVANDWGVFKEIYCAGNDSTFIFLETILSEVLELFPSKQIHIGGDEAPKYRWERCEKCQKRIADEGLADSHELQSYFITRIEKYLNSRGRVLIGWDEILEGGLAPNAMVQSWRGMEGGKKAAEMGHQVIMSPTSHCYLDYGLNSIDLEKIYSFDPVPADLEGKSRDFIIGGECNMWTERVPNDSVLDNRVFPRMIGLAANLWMGEDRPEFDVFYGDLQRHYGILFRKGVKYGLEVVPAEAVSLIENESPQIKLTPGVPGLTLKYRWPESEWEKFKHPIPLDRTGTLEIQAYKGSRKYGEIIKSEWSDHMGIGEKVTYQSELGNWYRAGGETALVDGMLGTLNFRDGKWQGFSGQDLDVEIELTEGIIPEKVSLQAYQYNNAWIFFPTEVEVFGTMDGKKWKKLGTTSPSIAPEVRDKHIWVGEISLKKKKAWKALKVVTKNIKEVPEWHEAAGSEAWIFVGEIMID